RSTQVAGFFHFFDGFPGLLPFLFAGLFNLAQREIKCEYAAATEAAFYFHFSLVCINHCFYIAEAKAESLHVVQVAGMRAVESLKNSIHRFLAHTNTVVFD